VNTIGRGESGKREKKREGEERSAHKNEHRKQALFTEKRKILGTIHGGKSQIGDGTLNIRGGTKKKYWSLARIRDTGTESPSGYKGTNG